jgi:hypothetical protein
MRRAPASLIACLLVVCLGGVLAAPAAAEGPPRIEAHFRADGFQVVLTTQDEGKDAVLYLTRGHRFATYLTKARLEGARWRADFGPFGKLDLTFHASRPPHCEFREAGGTLVGELAFRGENGYAHFRRHRIKAVYEAEHCSELPVPDSLPLAATAEPGITLRAYVGHRGDGEFVLATGRHSGTGFSGFLSGGREEIVGGVAVVRGVQAVLQGDALRFDLEEGTAALRPPGPFIGRATFQRRPGRTPLWRGSLRAPILGGPTLRLTGPRFHASLVEGEPRDE